MSKPSSVSCCALAESSTSPASGGFQYALTCSRPRLDAFGGGAHVIDLGTRKSIGWTSKPGMAGRALNGEDAMPEVICTTVYQFPELSDAAKEKARSCIANSAPTTIGGTRSMRISSGFAKSSASAEDHTRPPLGGGTRAKPCIWFSGFWSQGDGCLLRGLLVPRQGRGRAHPGLRHAGRDLAWHRRPAAGHPAAELLPARRRGQPSRPLHHEYTMSIDVTRTAPDLAAADRGREEIVAEALRDLARWLYRQLELNTTT